MGVTLINEQDLVIVFDWSEDFMWYLCLQGPDFEAQVAKLVELGFGRKQSYKLLNYSKEMKIRQQGFFLGVAVNIYF